MEIVIIILLVVLIGAVIFLILKQQRQDPIDMSKDIEAKLNEIFPQVMKNASDQLISMADQKLGAEKKEIAVDLINKKDAIEKMISQLLQEVNKNTTKLEAAERDRVGSFMALKQEMEMQKKLTEQLSVSAEGLRKVLSNNQMRGAFGEQVADDLLRMSGFVRGTDYEFNKEQAGSETRPDFCIFLPDGVRINIDAKFPFSNLQKMSETDDPMQKAKFDQAFKTDVKQKIKQVTTRDYINPEDNTVDFVILFIPNEMIFSYIYEKMNDVWMDAMQNKVILAGPFSFTAILRMVRQAYNNFSIQKDTQRIISQINTFFKEFTKYNEEFNKIGERINSLNKQYEMVERTRTNQLIKIVDKIKQDDKQITAEVKSIENQSDSQSLF